jgi:DNA repair protein RecO (recombination protein O)
MAQEITPAIILDTMDYRETSMFLYVYTSRFGKITLVGKGVRKQKSPMTGKLEPFTEGDLQFNFNEKHTLYTFQNFKPYYYPSGIRSQFNKIVSAFYVTELAQKTSMELHPNPQFYELLSCTLNLLNSSKTQNTQHLLRVFELKSIAVNGFLPNTDCCTACQKKDIELSYFAASHGGLLCNACAQAIKGKLHLSPGGLNFLRKAFQIEIRKMNSLTASQKVDQELKSIVQSIFAYYFERDFQSYKLLS